jgi:hypothetical protein
MPSRETSLLNLKLARAKWRRPKPWRSYQETVVIKRLVWQWLIYPELHRWSGRSIARHLGVSHTYVQKLRRKFMCDPTEMQRWYAHFGEATLEDLRVAKECTRQDWLRGRLRYPLLKLNRFPDKSKLSTFAPAVYPPLQRDGVMERFMKRLREQRRPNVGITGY